MTVDFTDSIISNSIPDSTHEYEFVKVIQVTNVNLSKLSTLPEHFLDCLSD